MELPTELCLEIIQYSPHIWRLFRQTNKCWNQKLVLSHKGRDRFRSHRQTEPDQFYQSTYWGRQSGSTIGSDETVWWSFRPRKDYVIHRRVGLAEIIITATFGYIDIRLRYAEYPVFACEEHKQGLVFWQFPRYQSNHFTPEVVRSLLRGTL